MKNAGLQQAYITSKMPENCIGKASLKEEEHIIGLARRNQPNFKCKIRLPQIFCRCRLVRINVEGPPLSEWDASDALELWTKEKVRRLNHKDEYCEHREKSTGMSDSESKDEARFPLEDWEIGSPNSCKKNPTTKHFHTQNIFIQT